MLSSYYAPLRTCLSIIEMGYAILFGTRLDTQQAQGGSGWPMAFQRLGKARATTPRRKTFNDSKAKAIALKAGLYVER